MARSRRRSASSARATAGSDDRTPAAPTSRDASKTSPRSTIWAAIVRTTSASTTPPSTSANASPASASRRVGSRECSASRSAAARAATESSAATATSSRAHARCTAMVGGSPSRLESCSSGPRTRVESPPTLAGEVGEFGGEARRERVGLALVVGVERGAVDRWHRVGFVATEREGGLNGARDHGVAPARCRHVLEDLDSVVGAPGAERRPRSEQTVSSDERVTADRAVDGGSRQRLGALAVEPVRGRQWRRGREV